MLGVVFFLLFLSSFNADPAPPAQNLTNKVMVGYQGWFVTGSDGAGMSWNHWSSTGKAPAPSQSPTNTGLAFDLWPDLSEYDSSVLYDTDLYYANGTRAKLFSAYNAPTVQLHVQWMQQYSIDGLFLQRFVSELNSGSPTLNDRNQVLLNVRTYAEKYQRTFAVMYDISGADPNTFNTTIINDWNWITSQGILNSPYYQFHNGKPVVVIWGMGFSDRNFSVSVSQTLIQTLKQKQTVMGGVPYYWRTGDHDSDPGWMPVYQSFDILQPWAVGRYGNQQDFDSCLQNVAIPDVNYIKDNNLPIGYNPVIFPGFSWANLQNTPSDYNQIPRQGGTFFCYQAQGVLNSLHPLFVYVAMFDEVNEATAVFKAASNKADTPQGATFLYLNVDGDNLPSDFYLKLTGSVNKAFKSGVGSGACTAAYL